ncbi:hypothetical protein [Sphingobacterium faecale]|uniref:Uncharacterized protein n=1 Tax=Sphingobacterium faecale TaxID=2803775 RepID=A0ABS1R111_9SPHI|nr:hypothetical protein [Sphingobacterium faecale]MBL1407591.1 hypothetical protein [Sphingobacterium faecale]
MKRLFFCLALMCALGLVKAQKLEVKIVQDGATVLPKDDVYVLSPKTFSFEIKSAGVEGFLVGVTTDEYIYKSALGEADLEVMWFDETGMAESLFNADKEVFVNDEAPSYWYFTSTKDHRFDVEAKGNEKLWQATRTVNSFYFMDTQKTVAVRNMKRPVYLFFYTPTYDESYNLLDKTCVFKAQLVWK